MLGIDRLFERRRSVVDSGFSLVELMVVLLILAILLAVAIPTLLGATENANDRAAQSNLTMGLTTAKAWESQNSQTYKGATAPNLHADEPSISFGDSTNEIDQGPVSVYHSADGNGIVLASFSVNNKTCWYTVDNLATVAANAGGAYGVTQSLIGNASQAPSAAGTWHSSGNGATSCNAGAAPTAAAPWSNQF